MAEGRSPDARREAPTSPARKAGLFRGLDPRGVLRESLRRPALPDDLARSYRRERVTDATLSIGLGLLDGGVVGVIAAKVFHVHPVLIATISAAPMFGNLSSALWARLGEHFRKVPLLVSLQVVFVSFAAAVGLLPVSPLGGLLLVALMIASRLLIGGMVTIRSVIWTHNYPRGARARVISRLSFLAQLAMTCAAAFGAIWLDGHEQGFATLYMAGAAVSAIGAVSYSGVVLRGEEPGAPPIGGARSRGAGVARPGTLRILREDPLFARYLFWQFVLGVSNMMVEPALIYAVTRQLHASFAWSIVLTAVLPLGIGMATLPMWAGYLDRVHIAEFRSRHTWLFVGSQAAVGLGVLIGSLPLLAAARTLTGVAKGGGSLAWQLGHNDFAHPERAGAYMGLHATLTGLRGAFAPFLGMALFVGIDGRALLGVQLPALPALGGWAMIGASVLGATAGLGFAGLHRRVRRQAG